MTSDESSVTYFLSRATRYRLEGIVLLFDKTTRSGEFYFSSIPSLILVKFYTVNASFAWNPEFRITDALSSFPICCECYMYVLTEIVDTKLVGFEYSGIDFCEIYQLIRDAKYQ